LLWTYISFLTRPVPFHTTPLLTSATQMRSAQWQSGSNTFSQLRRVMLPAMVGLLGLYITLHSPLRDLIASLFGMKSRGCFFCAESFSLYDTGNSVAALALIGFALVAAWIIAEQFNGLSYERPLSFGLCALALIVVPAAAMGVIAERSGTALLRPPFGPVLTAIPSAIFVAISVKHGWRFHWPLVKLSWPSTLVLVVGGVAVVTLSTSIVLSLMHPPTSGDALSYHAPLAVFLWRDGNLGTFLDRAPDIWALAHPGTAELWFGLLLIAAGEAIADLGQLPFTFLGSAAVYTFTRRLGLRHGAAMLAACGFLLIPMVVMQSGMQLNDIIGAALLMATIAIASAPIASWAPGRLALIGLGLGLVATTKLALLPCVVGVGLFVIGAMIWRGRQGIGAVAVRLMVVGTMFLIVAAPWWVRNVARYGNPVFPAALPLLGRGVFVHDFGPIDISFVPGAAAWPLYPFLEPHDDRSGFGALVLIGTIPGFVVACLYCRREALSLYLVVTAIMLPAWWLLTLHEPRFFLALVGLSFAFLPWALITVPRRQRNAAGVLIAAAAIFSALVTYDQALLPFARQPNTRAQFYDRVWGVDAVVVSLPETEGLLLNTGYAPSIFEYTSYYPLLGNSRSRTVIPVDSNATAETIVTRMRSAGIRYAYVTASPENRTAVETLYNRSLFEPLHVSTIVVGESSGARRYLYRLANRNEDKSGTRRYLYRLLR